MKILLDVMGGDHCPDEAIKGAVTALGRIEGDIILIGNEQIINEKSKEFFGKEIKQVSSRLSIAHAPDVIENTDIPLEAIKTKKQASMIKGFEMVKNGEGDVLISSGNTGAFMAGGLLLVGRIKGIDRPAITALMPAYNGCVLLIDAGANTNCRPINIEQFAMMGSIYMDKIMHIDNPRVGLLNIGAEETKGTDLTKESILKLKENKKLNFIGNIEGRYVFDGNVDVVVSDGFSGNVALKIAEGVGLLINKMLKEELLKNPITKAATMLLMKPLKSFKKRTDYTEYGGGILMGISKCLVKCHGGAKEKSFVSTIVQAENYVKSNAIAFIKKELDHSDDTNT